MDGRWPDSQWTGRKDVAGRGQDEGCIWEAVSGLESDYGRPSFSDQEFGLYAQDRRV